MRNCQICFSIVLLHQEKQQLPFGWQVHLRHPSRNSVHLIPGSVLADSLIIPSVIMRKQYSPLLSAILFAISILPGDFLIAQVKKYKEVETQKQGFVCAIPPKIECPSAFNGCPGTSTDPDVTGHAKAKPGQDGCPEPLVSFQDKTLQTGKCPHSFLIQRTWTATDPDDPNLRSFCIQYINTLDTTAPVFFNCPKDSAIFSNSSCVGVYKWITPAVWEECGNYCLKSSHPNGGEFPIGRTQVVITAEDDCGNSTVCTFHVEVKERCCQDPPVLHCPSDFVSCELSDVDPLVSGMATAQPSSSNCKGPVVKYVDKPLHIGTCLVVIERTWTASDPDDPSKSVSCVQKLTLGDSEPPTILFCPPNVTVLSDDQCGKEVFWQDPKATDHCGDVKITTSLPSGFRFQLGITGVVVIATDKCGNTSKCEFIIDVRENCCQSKPVIECPETFEACPGSSTDPSVSGIAKALPGGPNCPQPVISYRDDTLLREACKVEIHRTWIASIPHKNDLRDSCVQKIILKDEEPPVIRFCPPNVKVLSDEKCEAEVSWKAPEATDNCAVQTISTSLPSGFRFQEGITGVVVIATDACGNTSKCEFIVEVEANCCKNPPKLTCPPDYESCPGTSTDPSITGNAIAEPGSPGCKQPFVSYVDRINVDSACYKEIDRFWVAADPTKPTLYSTCTQRIVLKDQQAPTFSYCPPDVTVLSDEKCEAIVHWKNPEAEDACGAVQIATTIPSGYSFTLGLTGVVSIATDACGNTSNCLFYVTVEENCCNNPPVIHCPADYKSCPGTSTDPSITGQATVDPYHRSCQEAQVSYTDSVIESTNCRVVIDRIWTAINPKNQAQTTCIQRILLEDTEPPVFGYCPLDLTVQPDYNCEIQVGWDPAQATDACKLGSLTSNFNPGDLFAKGTSQVIYTATDACGNTNTCSFQVLVTDQCCDRNPVLQCPDDFVGCPGLGLDPSVTGYAVAGPGKPECEQPVIHYSDRVITDGPCAGAILVERSWIAEDPKQSGLRTTCSQLIQLVDDEAPLIVGIPEDFTVDANGYCDAEATWLPPTATDNCKLKSITSNVQPGSRFTAGTHHVVYTAVDFCGNVSRDSFIVKVEGTEIAIDCPADTTVIRNNPFLNGAIVDWTSPVVRYCKPCKDSIPGFIYMGNFNGHRYFCSAGPADWNTARLRAELNGGKLAVINSIAENTFVASRLNGQTAWIGGTDENSEGAFSWVDGAPFVFKNWLPGQPNNGSGNEDFIEMFPDGGWNDQNGAAIREFVMEVSCYDLLQIEGPSKGDMVPCGRNKISYVASKDGKKDSCSFYVTVDCDQESIYCKNKALNSKYMFINQVQFAGIDTITGDNGGYHYFNKPCGIIESNKSYTICLSPGYLSASYKVYWKVWIDYNADGFFDPVTEEVVYGNGNTTMCAEIKMPQYMPDKMTRMRVILSYSGYPTDPCTAPLFGEVEDYCIAMNGGGGFGQHKQGNFIKVYSQQLTAVEKKDVQYVEAQRSLGPENFELMVFPIPSSDKVFIQGIDAVQFEIEVFNHQGKQVYRSTPGSYNEFLELNVQDWESGVYNVICRSREGLTRIKRFVVNR